MLLTRVRLLVIPLTEKPRLCAGTISAMTADPQMMNVIPANPMTALKMMRVVMFLLQPHTANATM